MRQLLAILIVSFACQAASDPVYKALREAGIQESFPVENLVIHRTGPAQTSHDQRQSRCVGTL